ncbi:MAG TPA: DUF222 domain-containing protein [Candidatus Dormibacteraeota bacterium]|nr:DUF222 domain-containing protein [Candidatus Dormibacteraeota bacterium]
MTTGMTSRGLALLEQACAVLADEQIDELDDAALGEAITAVHGCVSLLEAQRSRFIRAFDARRGFASRASSMACWLRDVCHLTASAASSLVEVARHLPSLPAAERAFLRGEIGLPHARVMAGLVGDIGPDQARGGEELLVEIARSHDAGLVRDVARQLREDADAEATQQDANAMHARRRLDLSPAIEGGGYLDGRLDSEGMATAMAALDSMMAPVAGDTRTPRQRRADAFVELCRRQLDRGELPVRGGQRPHVTLTVSVDRLRGEAGAPAAQLDWAGPVTMETARRMICDARITTVVVDERGEPRVVGPEVEVVPFWLRRALVVRDGGCVMPGCHARPGYCDGHHLVPLLDGGATALGNLALLCRRCHRRVHEDGMNLRRTDDGGWEVTDPVGHVRRREPRPPPLRRAS